MKKYVKLLTAAILVSVVSNFAFAADGSDDKSSDDKVKQISSSKEAMLEAMADPIANAAFHRTQLQMLQTPSDAMVYNYFSQNEIFAPLYNFLVKHNDELIAGFELSAKSSMVQAVRGLTPKYDLIDKLVVDVASSLGFTKEAIQNRQIYILGGDENAFTVSGSQNKIVVAFQRGILRTMTRSEIAAILAHELGHIRAEHTVKGIMNSVMLEIVGELFVNGKLGIMSGGADFTKLAEDQCIGVCSHSKNILMQQNAMDPNTRFQSQNLVDQQIQMFVMNVAKMPKAELQLTVASYLQMMLQVAAREKAPVQTVRYMKALLENVKNIGMFKVSPQEYMQHAKMVEYAVSRAKESTADQISASTVRNEHLASSFAKLIGLDFDKEFRPQIFAQIKKQAQEILTELPPQVLPMVVGSTHPSLVLRINSMLTFPSYPSVLFANGYLRLLLINDALIGSKAQVENALANYHIYAEQKMAGLQEEFKEVTGGKGTPEQFEKTKEATQKQLDAQIAGVEKALANVTASADAQQKRVLDLLFSEQFPITAERSPRMDNTIQYLSITRELMLESVDKTKTQLKEAEAKVVPADGPTVEQAEAIVALEGTIKATEATLANQEKVIATIKDRLQTAAKNSTSKEVFRNVNKRVLLLDKILQAKTASELEDVRASVTTANPNLRESDVYRRNKIPVKLLTATGEQKGLACSKLFN